MAESADLTRLSFNQITSDRSSLREAVDACVRAGISWIAPWRHKLSSSVAEDARMVREAGLGVSSLCRGGMFPASTKAERGNRIDDNRRALEQAAAFGAGVLVLVCGPAPDRDIDAARQMVEDGIAALIPEAAAHGIRLGIEPLHPMFAAERSVIVTLAEANSIAERLGPQTGVVIDAYHVWWDPDLYAQIARTGSRIAGFHVSDWIVPTPDFLMGRGMMGDGVIELRRIRAAVDLAGYSGAVEVEIFNEAVWSEPIDSLLDRTKDRFLAHL